MIRGPISYIEGSLKATVYSDLDDYMVDFYENSAKLGTIVYRNKSLHYAEDAAENYINGIFKKEDVLKHVEQLELDL